MPPALPGLTPENAWGDPAQLLAANLEVAANVVVEGFMIGQHESPFRGSSVEFVQHRQYVPGDEVRRIDWRAFGKTGRYYIKEFEEETNLNAYLLLDASGSMAYAGKTVSKFAYARLLAAVLGRLLLKQRDAIGLTVFDTTARTLLEPSAKSLQFQHLCEQLNRVQPGGETSWGRLLSGLLPRLRKRSLLTMISDFYDDLGALEAVLRLCRSSRHDLLMIQVIAPEEAEFPFRRPTQFRSLEVDGQRLLVDPVRLREHYLESYQRFSAGLQSAALGAGFQLLTIKTDEPFGLALGRCLHARQRG